jgi:hypothetical protein
LISETLAVDAALTTTGACKKESENAMVAVVDEDPAIVIAASPATCELHIASDWTARVDAVNTFNRTTGTVIEANEWQSKEMVEPVTVAADKYIGVTVETATLTVVWARVITEEDEIVVVPEL